MIPLVILVLIGLGMINATAFDVEVGKLVKELGYLESKGVDVSSLIEDLDKAIKLYEMGERKEALKIIRSIEAEVSKLKAIANEVAMRRTIYKAVTVAALASIPVIVYFLLPRAYLYLWYLPRRKWIVEGVKR